MIAADYSPMFEVLTPKTQVRRTRLDPPTYVTTVLSFRSEECLSGLFRVRYFLYYVYGSRADDLSAFVVVRM
uniref:Uncharacterized protein n=1 Tax=Ascaris lumbricoides TaxID=6252 RepID=A0A0M3IL36_ASCLU